MGSEGNVPSHPGEGSDSRGTSRRRFLKLAVGAGGIAGVTALVGPAVISRLFGPAVLPPSGSCTEFLAAFDAHVVRGGPPKDGIPSIDRPSFLTATAADDFLEPTDIVFGVEYGGIVRAYPQRILVWHEIVNDVFDGQPVVVTYCPLTGSPIGFLPPRNDPAETFGTSGNLVNSNLLMYDRVTDSRWPQILGTAISGERCGTGLSEIPVVWTTWGRWRQRHPESSVLSADTGYVRNYAQDPYGTYNPEPDPSRYYGDPVIWFPLMRTSDLFHAKKVFYGLKVGDAPMAIPREEFRAVGVRNFDLSGVTLAAFHDPELDFVRVFRRETEGENLAFTLEGGVIRDEGHRVLVVMGRGGIGRSLHGHPARCGECLHGHVVRMVRLPPGYADPGGVAVAKGVARLREAVATRRLKALGLGVGIAYALVYLYALGHIAITPGRTVVPTEGVFRVVGLENVWRERAPYNYEPVAVFQPFEGFAIFLAVPNLILATALGTLVALNVALFVHTYLHYRHCGVAKSASGLVASLPAFLSGFACCAPSFVLLLGAVSAAAFVPFLEVVIPMAIAALFVSLGWNVFRPLPGPIASAREAVDNSGIR